MAQNSNTETPRFNLMLIGNHQVGKTSLLSMHVRKKFNPEAFATAGVDFLQKDFTSKDGTRSRIKIWDTGGQERFNSLVTSYLQGADGIIFVFDLTSVESFRDLRNWIQTANQQIQLNDPAESQSVCVPMVIVGNKLDLCKEESNSTNEREVETSQANEFARANGGLAYFETSAKDDIGIEQMMDYIMELTY